MGLGFFPFGIEHFFPIDRNRTGRLDAELHLITANLDHGDHDLAVSDHHPFVFLAGENKQVAPP
jgi:hypothetical protein